MVACYDGNGSHYIKHVDNPNNVNFENILRCMNFIFNLLLIFILGWEMYNRNLLLEFELGCKSMWRIVKNIS